MKKGIDVSYANDTIDWEKVKQAGIEFAILRSTFGSESPSQTDKQYFQNAQGCVKNGIPFGTYHFAYFTNEKKAIDEANFAIKKADEYKDYIKFIALDIEEDSVRYARDMGYSPNWTKCAIAFLDKVKSAGYIPVIYSNYSWLTNILDFEKIKNYKLWYAAPDASKPAYDCAIWQYSWVGKVSGINGDVDMDYLYEDSLFTPKNTTKTDSSTQTNKTNGTQSNDLNKIKLTEITSAKNVNYSVVITSQNGVNIRAGAGISKKIIGAIPYNTIVKVTKQTSGGNYIWGLITYKGITGWIALEYTKRTITDEILKKDDKVKVNSSAVVYGTNQKFSDFVYKTVFQVMEISGSRVVIGINGQITSAVDKKYLTKV